MILDELLKSNQFYVYGVGALGLAFLILAKLPVGAENFRKFLGSLRRSAVDKDDSDIATLKRQVKNLMDVSELRDRQDKGRVLLLEEHAKWDRSSYQILQILVSERSPGSEPIIEITFPPPLF